jgi:hypothetical protein
LLFDEKNALQQYRTSLLSTFLSTHATFYLDEKYISTFVEDYAILAEQSIDRVDALEALYSSALQ